MPILIVDEEFAQRIRNERAAHGHDRHDEVWDGTWMLMPPTDNCRQAIIAEFGAILVQILGFHRPPDIYLGINVSDRESDWLTNVRCPDFVVYLEGNPAKNCGTHYRGGPDFLVEITTPGDLTRQKLPFYASVNSREALVIDRDPWRLELYQLQNGQIAPAGQSDLTAQNVLTSSVLPLTFRLVPGTDRPQIEVVHTAGGQTWLV
jgi:Uma2 family endonuclease